MPEVYKFSNKEVVLFLKEMLAALEVTGANTFRIRAYQNAISAIDNSTMSVQDLWENGRLGEIPGVGPNLEQHLDELFRTGKVVEFEQAKAILPAGMFSLIGLRGIGAKKAYKLAVAFNLDNRENALEGLRKAAEGGKIRELDGFGEKSEKDILEAITETKTHKREKERMLLIKAEEVASRIMGYMEELDCVEKIVALGSMRRRAETVGDIDLAVATMEPEQTIKHFIAFNEVGDVLSEGDKKAAVVLKNDVQVDLRVIEPQLWGSMIQYFTGSKQHNVLLRTYALDKGLSLSEYGIKDKKQDKTFAFETEDAFYKKIGLPAIPPELRHGKDEIEAAKNSELPKLVDLSDIKGDVHVHTNASPDGADTLDDIVSTAISLGYKYIGISDHAPSIKSRGRLEVIDIIDKQRLTIEHINSSQNNIRVLFGYEVDILVSNEMALPNEILKKLDYVIGSVHSVFDQNRQQMTQRLLSAIENPLVDIIGHPSGRLINERDACDIDWEAIFSALLKHEKIIEINSQPSRLDLPYELVREAQKKGVKMIVNTDAHVKEALNLMRYGVDVARRGWCEKKDIANTLPLSDFLRLLEVDN